MAGEPGRADIVGASQPSVNGFRTPDLPSRIVRDTMRRAAIPRIDVGCA